MAETVVNYVLKQLADAATKEILFLFGAEKKVQKVERELIQIQAFLKDADSRPVRDERQRNWIKEVRDVGYRIEDVIDRAVLLKDDNTETESLPKKLESSRSRSSCFRCKTTVKKMFGKPKKIPALHKIGVEIDEILARIEEINQSRVTYGINNIGEGSGEPRLTLPIRPIIVPDIDDPNVIGFEKDIDNIVNLLLDENSDSTRRSVVSIVGTGGLGKTTLALKVYNRIDIKRHFDTKVWVTVSKEFKLIDVLKKIVKQFQSIDSSQRDEDEEYFLTKLHECCRGKRYLIVLDDVWTDALWDQLRIVLPDEEKGSRVLITSRSMDVAKEADARNKQYQLRFLTDEVGLQLLLRKALPSDDCPSDLLDLAKQFVKKCGGLPLALVVLGGLLSKKSDYFTWNKIMRTMNWSVDGRACTAVLASSFEDLPLSIKTCFMYLAIFPEDFIIDAKALIRMWVAEGLIPEMEKRTLEDTGESFLEELVQRCMIQVSSRLADGSIENCQLHDILRDFAIQKARDDSFLMVMSSNENELENCCNARRLAFHHSNFDELTKNVSENVRSLVCFGRAPDCSKKRLLKVLKTDKIEPTWLPGLNQLRYFELNDRFYNMNITADERCNQLLEISHLRKSLASAINMSSLKYLQTLDLREIGHEDLSDCIWHVKTLRHVMLCKDQPIPTTSGPPSWAVLKNLQTLTGIKSRQSWTTEGTPNLSNLRELAIKIVEGHSWEVVATLLETLKHVTNLKLERCIGNSDRKVPDMKGFPFYPQLQYLNLVRYDGSSFLNTNMLPIHLTSLYISESGFKHDPMPILEKLQNLKILSFDSSYYSKRQMKISAQGFVQLESLQLQRIGGLDELVIEKGAMPILKKLTISRCFDHGSVPLGLQFLTSLNTLKWGVGRYVNPFRVKNEIQNLCKHVPSVQVW